MDEIAPCKPPCEARREAMATWQFAYSDALKGWITPGAPVRRPSEHVLKEYVAGTRETLPERVPYVWHTCPWCGGEIPR